MPADLNELVAACNRWLSPDRIKDYCPNGLQVQGKSRVQTIVTGVTASQKLIDRAIELNADLILVHHGYFWKGESSVITGMKYQRIASLIKHDIGLLAYHLPLDVNDETGNNVELGRLLGFKVTGALSNEGDFALGLTGECSGEPGLADLARMIEQRLGRKPLVIEGTEGALAGNRKIDKVAWCTGAAQGFLEQAAEQGVDVYISGEVSEPTVHMARESGVHYIAAGHHATERYGVKALGERLARSFDVQAVFVDIDNPV
ncbi:MAG: Nif3-like dinuclear metal center hexameric protein [Gammaproteobacteria bacterium]|nr:MAG: Nif3-like dinuclear metal center hexameric protein [Pseudomonadota bacterium]PIE38212.1 MAG: Nif3-like dinuclear metal center hexameric protein [Gammaproteobacteria bacterium]